MSFIRLERIEDGYRGPTLARAGLRKVRNAKFATLKISIEANLLRRANPAGLQTFDVLIGADESAGRLRLIPAPDGIAHVKLNGASTFYDFFLGRISAYPNEQHGMAPCEVREIDGAIEVGPLPWCEEGPTSSPKPPAKKIEPIELKPQKPVPKAAMTPAVRQIKERLAAAPASTPQPKRQATPSREPTSFNGVTCEFSGDGSAIVFDGKIVETSERGAHMISMLAKVMPSGIGYNFMIGKLWTGRAPTPAVKIIDDLVDDLTAPLASVGLKLNRIKNIQISLSVVK
jgi:hypothetical protein